RSCTSITTSGVSCIYALPDRDKVARIAESSLVTSRCSRLRHNRRRDTVGPLGGLRSSGLRCGESVVCRAGGGKAPGGRSQRCAPECCRGCVRVLPSEP